MMLRLAFGRPWRQTEGLLRSVARLRDLEVGIPDHTMLLRRSAAPLSRRSAPISLATDRSEAKGPVHRVIDGTELKVYGAGEGYRERQEGRDRRCWRKRHRTVDPDRDTILVWPAS